MGDGDDATELCIVIGPLYKLIFFSLILIPQSTKLNLNDRTNYTSFNLASKKKRRRMTGFFSLIDNDDDDDGIIYTIT